MYIISKLVPGCDIFNWCNRGGSIADLLYRYHCPHIILIRHDSAVEKKLSDVTVYLLDTVRQLINRIAAELHIPPYQCAIMFGKNKLMSSAYINDIITIPTHLMLVKSGLDDTNTAPRRYEPYLFKVVPMLIADNGSNCNCMCECKCPTIVAHARMIQPIVSSTTTNCSIKSLIETSRSYATDSLTTHDTIICSNDYVNATADRLRYGSGDNNSYI